jgi:hypothetical protein
VKAIVTAVQMRPGSLASSLATTAMVRFRQCFTEKIACEASLGWREESEIERLLLRGLPTPLLPGFPRIPFKARVLLR